MGTLAVGPGHQRPRSWRCRVHNPSSTRPLKFSQTDSQSDRPSVSVVVVENLLNTFGCFPQSGPGRHFAVHNFMKGR